ncbi:hypothetical protein C8R46DRAFT_1031589 [Mycena filopes]|nr:hypothetical protein C8R46DRAFT_1031589 [Mycena filopes]
MLGINGARVAVGPPLQGANVDTNARAVGGGFVLESKVDSDHSIAPASSERAGEADENCHCCRILDRDVRVGDGTVLHIATALEWNTPLDKRGLAGHRGASIGSNGRSGVANTAMERRAPAAAALDGSCTPASSRRRQIPWVQETMDASRFAAMCAHSTLDGGLVFYRLEAKDAESGAGMFRGEWALALGHDAAAASCWTVAT